MRRQETVKIFGTVVTCLFKGLLYPCFVCACYKHIHVGIRLGVHVEEICAPRRCFLSEIELYIPNIFLLVKFQNGDKVDY